MGRVRRALWNTSTATSAAATGQLDDTVDSVLPVALQQPLKNWICPVHKQEHAEPSLPL